jgi:TonB family protein
MDVTDVLRERMAEPAGLQRMLTISLLVHAGAFAMLLLAPSRWLPSSASEPKTVMTISLGGGNGGPMNGGFNAIGGKAVQEIRPPDAKLPEPVRPPAAKTPEMTVPLPAKTPAKVAPPRPVVKQAPDEARGRTPTRGAETREGSAIAETGARGQGFGLSTGGGSGSGSYLDVGNFCCPDYIAIMVQRIQANWNSQSEVPGEVFIKFTIQRDGTITEPQVERASPYQVLNINALRAVVGTKQLPPLPAQFSNATLGVHLQFEYKR